SKAALLWLSETDVASDLLVSHSGSSQTTLSFWIDPKSGTQYAIAAQTPQFRLASLGDLATTPVTGTGAAAGGGGAGGVSGGGRAAQLLANLASFHRSVAPAVVSHYDATPVVDIFGAVEGADLGIVAAQIQRVLAESKSSLPRGSQVAVHGQVKTMTDSFAGLLLGDAAHAAVQAGVTRFRPVLMTALAMIIGIVPMALGLGEGGEQNAPLGRAVIGGLIFATLATLFFVPTVFKLVHGRRSH